MLRCGMIVLWGIEEFNLNKGWPSTGPFTIQEWMWLKRDL